MRSAAALLTAIVVAVVPATAQAGKPAPAAGASITLNESDPHLGGTVSFTTVYDSRIKSPRVEVRCTQQGEVVYADAAAVGTVFTLGSVWSPWVERGGAASCTATLYHFTYKGVQQSIVVHARTAFDAAG